VLCTLKLDKPLIRTVRAGRGYQVAIFPTTTRSTAAVQRGEGVVITLRGPRIYLADSGPKPTSVQALRAQGLLLSAYVNSGINRGVILVPDGVSKVTLANFRLLAPSAVRLDQLPQTTSAVSDNVALFQLSGLTEQSLHLNPQRLGRYFSQGSGRGCRISFAIYELPATAQMSWLNPAGNTIRRTTTDLRLYVGTRHPAPGTTSQIPGCTQ
jgi:hypothetical protein